MRPQSMTMLATSRLPSGASAPRAHMYHATDSSSSPCTQSNLHTTLRIAASFDNSSKAARRVFPVGTSTTPRAHPCGAPDATKTCSTRAPSSNSESIRSSELGFRRLSPRHSSQLRQLPLLHSDDEASAARQACALRERTQMVVHPTLSASHGSSGADPSERQRW